MTNKDLMNSKDSKDIEVNNKLLWKISSCRETDVQTMIAEFADALSHSMPWTSMAKKLVARRC